VEDNTFQIAEPSVSSRHCEILLRGSEIVVKDLNSTNGTFINGEKISEAILKPGQTLRLGNIDLRLDTPGAPAAAAPPPPTAPSAPPPSPKKEPAKAATGGVSLTDLESGGRNPGFDTKSVFTKKKKSKNMVFWIVVGVAIVIIAGLILYAVHLLHGSTQGQ
jgi:pSer/pThr/pTyr-binding forkhead associated (FHA) protein